MSRVMVVDDATTVRMFHRQLMESIDFEVVEAANGVEALERALAIEVDLFIVDVNMPKMDGYTLVKEIRRSESLAEVPVIFVSTEAEARDRRQALEAGANWYVVKPADQRELTTAARLLTQGVAA